MKLRALAGLLVLAGTAHAQEDFITARLSWQRSEGAEACMAPEALRHAVATRLQRDPFVEAGEDVTLEGRLSADTNRKGWVAQIELLTRNGELIGTRTLRTQAEHCSALDESLPLVVALMLDVPREELRREQAAATRPSAEPAPSRPVRRTTPISVPRETHAPRQPWQFQFAALATGAVGLLPGLAFGGGISIGVEPPTFWLTELDLVAWLPAEAEKPDGGARFRMLTVGLYLCPLSFESEPLRLDVCGGQKIGRITVEGFGFDRNRRQDRLSYSLGARTRGWMKVVGPVRVGLGAGAEIPLSRDDFLYTAANRERPRLFRMAPVVGAAEALLGVSLP